MPVSRLTFCAYLVNGIVELYYVGQLRHPVHITLFTVVRSFADQNNLKHSQKSIQTWWMEKVQNRLNWIYGIICPADTFSG